jgi:hypothetical protein
LRKRSLETDAAAGSNSPDAVIAMFCSALRPDFRGGVLHCTAGGQAKMFNKDETSEWLPKTAIELCEFLTRLIVELGIDVVERAREVTKSRPNSLR